MWWVLAAVAADTVQVEGVYTRLEVTARCDVQLHLGDDPVRGSGKGLVLRRSGSTLVVEGSIEGLCTVKGGYQSLKGIMVAAPAKVQLGDLKGERIDLVGIQGAELVIESIQADRLAITLANRSTAQILGGQVQFERVRMSGGSVLQASSLQSDDCSVWATLSSQVEVSALRKLDVEASGTTHIRYQGTPTQRLVKADFSSTVRAL